MRLVVVSGLSGSGKTVALHMLEDLGYYCIDNIPAGLLSAFVSKTVTTSDPTYARTAVGVDARNPQADLESVPTLIDSLRDRGVDCEVIFLHADAEVLLKRYSETRRRHPLSSGGLSLSEAIAREAQLLEPISARADLTVDTTRTSVHELRELVRERVDRDSPRALSLQFESFGFKNGVPRGADFVFDARSLPNPYWEPRLRALTGRDAPVAEYLSGHEDVRELLGDIIAFLEKWIPRFERTNRIYLTVAIGCTGGQHRSVYLIERLVEHFDGRFAQVLRRHRELP